MMPKLPSVACLVCVAMVCAAGAVQTPAFNLSAYADLPFDVVGLEVLHSTVSVEFNWTGSNTTRNQAIADGSYVPENNLITGLGYYDGTLYLCVPRWRHGVPATLAKATVAADGQLLLEPFPSWEWQSKLYYVQSLHIDHQRGIMWVIDTGRTNFFDVDQKKNPTIDRHASIHLFNLTAPGTPEIDSYTFDNDILPLNSSFLNDIVVDGEKEQAYMPDTNVAGLGALIFWDRKTRQAFRFQDPNSTYSEGLSAEVVINGLKYPGFTSPVDGIAMSADAKHIYYSAVEGVKLHKIPTPMLWPNASLAFEDRQRAVEVIMNKSSPGDGMAMIPRVGTNAFRFDDIIMFGANNLDEACFAQTARNERVIVHKNSTQMQWLDSLSAVPGQYHGASEDEFFVYFTTNRLQKYFVRTMDWNGTAGANMRVFRMHGKAKPAASSEKIAVVLGVVCGVVGIALIVGGIVMHRRRKAQSEESYYEAIA